ncbi:CBS domain-containing protein [Saccharopolyspora pogona]|uniref:CBS domain-containing protein n=1 Tax=Saccharopolyspora pogona TaxID=333966 RepID=UPI001CC22949|nr:CBS domain-containing protein [Saccharopolyspora pogona]
MIEDSYPGDSKATVANWTGQLWRLVAEIQESDHVVMPLKTRSQQIAIGRVSGPYRFDSDAPPGFQHVRAVDWIRKDVPRDSVQRDLLDSMGSLLTICRLQRFQAAERVAALAAEGVDPGPSADEHERHGVRTPRELVDKAVAADPKSPIRLSIRELLACWGLVRRTPANIAAIETDLSELGLTTKPPFTEGWIDNVVEIVPVGEEPGESEALDSRASTENTQDVSEFPPITLRLGMLKPANNGVASVRPEDKLSKATTRMLADNYSQLAVIDGEGNLRGAVSWESIGQSSMSRSATQVSHVIVPARTVDHREDLLSQLDEIYRSGYVFVRGADQSISGIVTTADLTGQFGDTARPFVLIEEAERRLRRRVDEAFSLEEIQNVAPRRRRSTISSAADLTLGNYKYLLEPTEHWRRLEWPLDHEVFLDRLDQVREIRNELMHFTPDPLNNAQLDCLTGFVRMLRTVDPRD